MQISYRKNGSVLICYFSGELDEFSASNAKKQLDELIDENLNVSKTIFDLTGLTFMDSTGIGMLLGRYKKLQKFNIPCFISGANINLEKILEFSGLYNVMPKM